MFMGPLFGMFLLGEDRVKMAPCPSSGYVRYQVSTDLAPEPTRRDALLGMLQKEFPNYHPLISIARIAHHGDADLKLQFECHKTIAKYVEPELKSIEVKGEINGRHRVSVSLFEPAEASFSPVSGGGAPPLEGSAVRVLESTARELPGGAVIDVEDAVVDRVTGSW